jgi:hypothetical protein
VLVANGDHLNLQVGDIVTSRQQRRDEIRDWHVTGNLESLRNKNPLKSQTEPKVGPVWRDHDWSGSYSENITVISVQLNRKEQHLHGNHHIQHAFPGSSTNCTSVHANDPRQPGSSQQDIDRNFTTMGGSDRDPGARSGGEEFEARNGG